MSSKGKKKKNSQFGDVTINDFANAPVCKNRIKKSNQLIKQVDERNWDEKEDDFYDFDFVEEKNEDGTKSVVRREKSHRELKVINGDNNGKVYPLDIWFLISEYIRPVNVKNFALICRGSWSVTCSAKFWFGLYRKYYRGVSNLPERLQPESMVCLYGLRTCVIRALHHFYQPFIDVGKCVNRTFHEHPSALVKRICVTAWHERITKNNWLYRWKLRDDSTSNSHPTSHSKPDLLEMLDDVNANAEHNCRILQLSCPHFIAIPPVMGLRLINAKVSLSQGFSSNRVTLKFSTGGTSIDNNIEIVLDPVINAVVLDWWHPNYPHPILNTPCVDNGFDY